MIQEVRLENICSRVKETGLCSGCGVCAGICPVNALKMEWNKFGEYEPVVDNRCTECGLCLSVCPFGLKANSENVITKELYSRQQDIGHHDLLGYYAGLFSGYSKKFREGSSSGGLTKWFLAEMLRRKEIDSVCCVRGSDIPGKLFTAYTAEDENTLNAASRSAYYPVEFSDCLKIIQTNDKRYAFVGLPCVIKALRQISRKNKIIQDRVVITLGLTCGQLKSRFFAEYMCALSGGIPGKMTRAAFRNKDPKRHHLDHRFECACNGEMPEDDFYGSVYQSGRMGRVWGLDYFKLKACNFCDDIVAETADVSFCDAIEEPYCEGNHGANFVIVRDRRYLEVFESAARRGDILLHQAPVEAVAARQQGVALLKRDDLAHRLFFQKDADVVTPIEKRVEACRRRDFSKNWNMLMRDRYRTMSRWVFFVWRESSCLCLVMEGMAFVIGLLHPFYSLRMFLGGLRNKLLRKK